MLQADAAGPGESRAGRRCCAWTCGRPPKVSDSPPDLHMLNLVVTGMARQRGLYRRRGVAVPGGQDAAGARVQLRMPGGFSLELDTAGSARPWHAAWR